MSLVDTAIGLLVGGFVAVFVLMFVWEFVLERDGKRAAQKTSRRAGGLLVGAGGMAATVAVVGAEVVAQAPELVITAIGVGAILAGFSWEVFLAAAVVAWIGAEAVTGGDNPEGR